MVALQSLCHLCRGTTSRCSDHCDIWLVCSPWCLLCCGTTLRCLDNCDRYSEVPGVFSAVELLSDVQIIVMVGLQSLVSSVLWNYFMINYHVVLETDMTGVLTGDN